MDIHPGDLPIELGVLRRKRTQSSPIFRNRELKLEYIMANPFLAEAIFRASDPTFELGLDIQREAGILVA